MGDDPLPSTLTHTGGAKGEGAFPHGHKTISICLQDRPHRWVSWGHAAAGTCGKEMSLCSALDIRVIQSIAPMCKKSTRVAPFQMAGNAECQGQRQILSQPRALFYFNWVGLGEVMEVVWGWTGQQHRLGTSHCPFLWSHITSGLKLLRWCHRHLEVPGQAHLFPRAEVSASSCCSHSQNPCHILPKKFMVTFQVTTSTIKPFPRDFGAQGSPSPCRPSPQHLAP